MNRQANRKRERCMEVIETPWGRSYTNKLLAPGIRLVSTASHGGYHVDASLLHLIPESHRAWAKKWSGSEEWYEEDCCWAAVCLAFPHLFPADAPAIAQSLVDYYVTPKELANQGEINWLGESYRREPLTWSDGSKIHLPPG